MKKNLIFAVLLAMLLGGCSSSEPTETNSGSQNGAVSEQTSETASEENAAQDSGELGKAFVKIGECARTKDYEGKDAIVVTLEYTNNDEKAQSFMTAVICKAFQNGVELSSAVITDDSYSSENNLKEIKTGATITVHEAYLLDEASADVEFEAEEFMSFSDEKLSKIFSIAE